MALTIRDFASMWERNSEKNHKKWPMEMPLPDWHEQFIVWSSDYDPEGGSDG